MQAGRASRTAEYNALFRALESSLPEDRRLFADPLARSFPGSPSGRSSSVRPSA